MTASSPLPTPSPASAWAAALRSATLACLPLLALAPAAQAGPLVFAPFSGSGNVSVFDPVAGSGGWTGTVAQFPDPGVAEPLSLVSVVLFQYDRLTQMLSGQFTFTRSADLGASMFGVVSGKSDAADWLVQGGQLALDYSIQGGTGDFGGASGFGLSFLQYDPAGSFDNHSESGLLAFTVPEPGTLPLLAGALLALGWLRRHPRHRPGV
jgi:hypothetical protein